MLFFLYYNYFLDPPKDSITIRLVPNSWLLYEEDDLSVTCEIEDGKPTANITWMYPPSVPGLTQTEVIEGNIKRKILTGKAHRDLDQENLLCKVHHFAWLDKPEKEKWADRVTVYCKYLNRD